ncbi:MAG: hypothetical protein E7413_00555 [Ruminococcaceae bacterium]|nr:hypothetical protein [Oscillospiraceae bacterium]
MKRFVSFVLTLFLAFGCIPVYAYEIPNAFWGIDRQYQAAVSAKDYAKVIQYAKKEIDLMMPEPENEQVLQIIGSRMEMIAKAYEALEDYPNAADYFERYVYYAEKLNWQDAVKIAKAKVLHYRPRLEMFEQTSEEEVYFHAKNEPHMGVLFGATSDGGIRDYLENESAVLLYHEVGSNDFGWFHHIFRQAEEKNIRVVFALNVGYEGSDIRNIYAYDAFFDTLIAELQKYQSVPVYFRFAAEVNIWTNPCTPEEFITAFRYVANRVHNELPNAAMVWSVNQSSAWNINMHDYYPGDEFVDWVGVASYLAKYFLGRNDWSPEEQFNDNVFFAGDSADAVLSLEEIVASYGDRKPIMLTESGVAHYINSLSKDETEWAINHLHQQYEFLPKVYPQIKAIMYFDKRMPTEVNDYSLSDNAALANEYLEEIEHPYFIHGSESDADVTYHKVTESIMISDDSFTFGVYPHVYKNSSPKVDVYFDNYYLESLVEPHFQTTLYFDNEPEGNHTLKLVIDGVIEKEYQIQLEKPIKLYLNGERLKTDVPPVIQNGRTLVPVRIISENLDTKVTWFEDRREVFLYGGKASILMGIDYPKVIVNGKTETIDVPPTIIDGRTLVPIRFLAEQFDLTVSWDEATRSVYLNQ